MLEPIDWTRLTRYISGECTAAEATSTKAWIAADPDRREIADHLQEIWESVASLSWLVAHFAMGGERLRKGDLVTPGSPVELVRVEVNDRVETHVGGIGTVAAQII